MERKKRRREEREREEEHLDEEDLELIGEHNPAFKPPAATEVCETSPALWCHLLPIMDLIRFFYIVQIQATKARPQGS